MGYFLVRFGRSRTKDSVPKMKQAGSSPGAAIGIGQTNESRHKQNRVCACEYVCTYVCMCVEYVCARARSVCMM